MTENVFQERVEEPSPAVESRSKMEAPNVDSTQALAEELAGFADGIMSDSPYSARHLAILQEKLKNLLETDEIRIPAIFHHLREELGKENESDRRVHYVELATSFNSAGCHEQALELINDVLVLAKGKEDDQRYVYSQSNAYSQACNLLAHMGEHKRAYEAATYFQKKQPQATFDFVSRIGVEYVRDLALLGKFKKAQKIADSLTSVYSGREHALSEIACAQALAGNLEEAKVTVQEADGSGTRISLIYAQIAHHLTDSGQDGDARNFLRLAVEEVPLEQERHACYEHAAAVYFDLALFQIEAGDVSAAATTFRLAKRELWRVPRDGSNSDTWRELTRKQARIQAELGDLEGARKEASGMGQVCEAPAFAQIAIAQFGKGDIKGGLDSVDEATKIFRGLISLFKGTGLKWMLESADQVSGALIEHGETEILRELISKFRDVRFIREPAVKSKALLYLAQLSIKMNDFQAAEDLIREMQGLDFDNNDADQMMNWMLKGIDALSAAGQPERCQALLSPIIALLTEDPAPPAINLGKAREKLSISKLLRICIFCDYTEGTEKVESYIKGFESRALQTHELKNGRIAKAEFAIQSLAHKGYAPDRIAELCQVINNDE